MRNFLLSVATVSVMATGVAAQDQDVYKAPVLIKEVKPNYTEGAMRRKVQGTVELSAVVTKDGDVGGVSVIQSLDPELDEEAIKAAKQWRFRPGTKDGKPVNVQVSIVLTFTLKK